MTTSLNATVIDPTHVTVEQTFGPDVRDENARIELESAIPGLFRQTITGKRPATTVTLPPGVGMLEVYQIVADPDEGTIRNYLTVDLAAGSAAVSDVAEQRAFQRGEPYDHSVIDHDPPVAVGASAPHDDAPAASPSHPSPTSDDPSDEPDESWTKAEIQAELDEHGIEYSASDTKAQLLDRYYDA
jgi:hypothetical protein